LVFSAYQKGKTLSSPPNTDIRMNGCPGHEGDVWRGGYDWRYGGIRPQDNPDMALYPSIVKYVEETYEKDATHRKVVVTGISGGTINAYAFLMSQPLAWRQK
jgi:hypothetical protein